VRAAPNQEMATDWWVTPWGENGDGGGQKHGRWTESMVDGEGGDVLERGCEEAELRGEQDGGQRF
jgi:hypothetical protein